MGSAWLPRGVRATSRQRRIRVEKYAAIGANGGAAQGGVAREFFPARGRHSCGARSTPSLEQERRARQPNGFDPDRNVRPFVRRGYDPGGNRRDVRNERHRADRSKNSRSGHHESEHAEIGNGGARLRRCKNPVAGTKDVSPLGETDANARLTVYPALHGVPKYQVVLNNADHSVFADRALPGDRSRRNMSHHRVIRALSTAFWDAYLQDNKDALAWLNGTGPRSVMEPADDWKASPEK